MNDMNDMNEIHFKSTKPGSKVYDYLDHTWVLNEQLDLYEVLKLPEFQKFEHCATIVYSNNTAGFDIKLEPNFVNQNFVIYMITTRGKILKGGKSKNSLDTRSYGAGTEESWTERGTPSVTNYAWSQIFRQCLSDGYEVRFYGMVCPTIEMTYPSFDGEIITEKISPYESEEKKLNGLLNKLNGKKVIGEGKLLAPFKS